MYVNGDIGCQENNDDFDCIVCLRNAFEDNGSSDQKWFQCSEGHLLCENCYLKLGGALGSCPVCNTTMGRIRNRIVEKIRFCFPRRVHENVKGNVPALGKSLAISRNQKSKFKKSKSQQKIPFLFLTAVLIAHFYNSIIDLEMFEGLDREDKCSHLSQNISDCLAFQSMFGFELSIETIRNFSNISCPDIVNKCRSAANEGREEQQLWIANLLERGVCGYPADLSAAAHYLRLAADQGNPEAQYNLALYYADGTGGLTMDPNLSAYYLQLAAKQGLREALRRLSAHHRKGVGVVEKDLKSAARLYALARNQSRQAKRGSLRLRWRRRDRRG